MAWVEFDPQFIGEVAFWVFGQIPACSRRSEPTTSMFGLLWFVVKSWGKESKGVGGGISCTQGPPWPPCSPATRGMVEKKKKAGGGPDLHKEVEKMRERWGVG